MRYGVFADVHANLPALQAVLAALAAHGIDRYIVAGDLVGYGPHPNECVELIGGLDSVCVAGNHDLMVLGRLSDERCIALARRSLRWTEGALNSDSRSFLESLPTRANSEGRIEVAHGSLDDPQEYTVGLDRARSQLARVKAERGEGALLVLGHTHRAFACTLHAGPVRIDEGRVMTLAAQDTGLLNPGAVGQSRELRARARCVVLDLEAREAVFLGVPYDVAACRRDLRRVGLSPRSYHLRPSPMRAAARIARAVRRRSVVASRLSRNDR